MKYIVTISVLILWCSFVRFYESTRRLEYSIESSLASLEKYKKTILICEQIAKMRGKPLNYYVPEKIDIVRNEYEEYINEAKELSSKLGYLTTHNMMLLDKWTIRRDKLSGELFFGIGDDIRIRAEYDELLINSHKVNIDEVQILPHADQYNIEYKKYTYDHCNHKIDTFSISRMIDIN